MEQGSVLDTRVWDELKRDMPAGAIMKLATTFATNQGRDLEAMRGDLQSGDRETLRRRAHSLKGAARLFGAEALAEVAARLETSATSIEQTAAIAQIDALTALFTQAVGEISAKIATLSVAA